MGLLIILNAAITIGPAGAFRLVNRKVHRVLDIVVIVILTVSVFQTWVEVDVNRSPACRVNHVRDVRRLVSHRFR